MKRLLLAAVAAAPFVVLPAPAEAGGGCGQLAPEQEVPLSGVATIRVEHACFTPAVVAVPKNTRVEWRNFSDLQHNVTGARIGFADLPPRTGIFADTYSQPGFYPYACTLHAGMSGVVHVLSGEQRPETAPVAATRKDDGTPLVPYAATAAITGLAAFALGRTSRRRGVVEPHGAEQ